MGVEGVVESAVELQKSHSTPRGKMRLDLRTDNSAKGQQHIHKEIRQIDRYSIKKMSCVSISNRSISFIPEVRNPPEITEYFPEMNTIITSGSPHSHHLDYAMARYRWERGAKCCV